MAFSRINDYLRQASTLQPPDEHRKLSSKLDDLEQWVSIVDNLSDDQIGKISSWLRDKFSSISTFDQPTGTQKQQTDTVERLTKFQQSKLYRKHLSDISLDDLIKRRLNALIHADGDKDVVIADPKISVQPSNPASAVEKQSIKSATPSDTNRFCTKSKHRYALISTIWKEMGNPAVELDNAYLTINGPYVTVVGETQPLEYDFGEQRVESVQYELESETLRITFRFNDDKWDLEFEQREDAAAVLSLLARMPGPCVLCLDVKT